MMKMNNQHKNLDDELKSGKYYKLEDQFSIRGLSFGIENKKGSIREGVDNDGTPWKTKMFYPYGYIKKTQGVDGDYVDCYLGPNQESDKVFVVHQKDPQTDSYDEDKVMLFFDTLEQARDAYLAHYNDQEFLGSITEMEFDKFKEKVLKTRNKPKILKSIELLMKSQFGKQLGMFDQPTGSGDSFEGKIESKDGKNYVWKRSNKNPNVIRRFRNDDPDLFSQSNISDEATASEEKKNESPKLKLNAKHVQKEKKKLSLKMGTKEDPDLFSQTHNEDKSTNSNQEEEPQKEKRERNTKFFKTIYHKNFDKLEKIFPTIDEMKVGFYRKLYDSDYTEEQIEANQTSYMPLSFEVLYKDDKNRLIAAMEHNYVQNGDLMTDPRMDIRIDLEEGIIEALNFEMNGMGVYREVYPEEGKVNIKEKKEQNDFLSSWLKNLINQGFKDTTPSPENKLFDSSKYTRNTENETKRGENSGISTNEKDDKNNYIDNFGVVHLDKNVRKQRIEINKKVKELISSKSSKDFSEDDKRLLAQYSGRGGTDEVSLNEYYTPDWVAKFQWDTIKKFGFNGGTVLEPSCGTGVFLHTAPNNTLITGVEFDDISSTVAAALFPDQEILNMSFEEFNTSHFEKGYDAAIGNVPFGPRGATTVHDPEKRKYKVHEQYFLDRIIDDLDDNGIASIIVPTGIMDNQISDYRFDLNKKAEFLGAIRMPTGVFKKANAQVTTDIVFLRKRPSEIIKKLNNLDQNEMQKMYDNMILDSEFISGSFFEKNPEFALGEIDTANYGRKIWKGEITEADLIKVSDNLNFDGTDYSVINGINTESSKDNELNVGDTIVRNGRTYRLNENHRWERVEDIQEQTTSRKLDEDEVKMYGINTEAELKELRSDPSKYIELSRESLIELIPELEKELKFYSSTDSMKDEMLKRGAVLGLEIRKFQKEMQEGIRVYGDNGKTEYQEISTADAQKRAQKLSMMIDDFIQRYGNPYYDAKLGSQMGKSNYNPFLYLCSSIDSTGKLSRLFTDPKSFYTIYHPSGQALENYDSENLHSIIEYLRGNGFSSNIDTIIGKYAESKNYSRDEFRRKLLEYDDIYIDEKGEYDKLQNVCMGEVYNKLDYWSQRRDENKSKLSTVSDSEREYLVAENRKLEEQELELKRRADIRTIENLPININDCRYGFWDIKYLNDFLSSKYGSKINDEIIYNEDNNLFTFKDKIYQDAYKLFMSKSHLDSDEKSDLNRLLDFHFDGEKMPFSMLVLNTLNGLSIGSNISDWKRDYLKELQTDFPKYLAEAVPNRDEVENKYNRAYNNFIEKQYDSSLIKGLSKLDYEKVIAKDKNGNDIKVKDAIKSHQNQVVRRMVDQGSGMYAHGVGLGKTLEAILTGLTLKETGKANKPTYVVPKSVLGNWAAEINKWTKDTKIIIVGAHKKVDKFNKPVLDDKGREIWVEDSADEKKLKLSRLANEEFDMILMTRDFYSSIPMSPKSSENMINELVEKFYVSSGDDTDKRVAAKKASIAQKIANDFAGNYKFDKDGIAKRNDEIYFENLGIDCVFGDEAHSYKNLIESVLNSDIKYLNVKHSFRSMDYYFKSKVIRAQNNDRGVFMLTATPISNSPIEAFNMMLPIAEKHFERMGINNVDDFVSRFAEVDYVPTMNASAKIVKKRVFTKFKNLNLLRKSFFKYADYKTSEMVGAEVHFPKEKSNYVYCDMSDSQKHIMKGLKNRLGLHEYNINNAQEMQKLISDGLISKEEYNELLDYQKEHRQKEKNISDLNPKKDPNEIKDHYFQILDDMKKATADLEWYNASKSEWADEIPEEMNLSSVPKFDNAVNSAVTKYNSGAKQLIFATNTALHDKLKNMLVTQGIPENEILIVNGKTMKSPDKRVKASEDFNSGKYKVVIGNYDTMGEGLNFNNGCTDIHHLQPAWNALAIEQGNGRGIRQGNKLDHVNTHYYLTKGSIDAFFNQKILDKRGFVNEILNGTEDFMEQNAGDISAEEMQIALAENPEQARTLLEKKNKAMEKLLKEREIKQNYTKLDNLFSMKSRLARMEDGSLAKETLKKEINEVIDNLNSSDNFHHKDVLLDDERPVIMPSHNKVVKIGTVIDLAVQNKKAIVTGYSHSTGKIKVKVFDGYRFQDKVMELKSLVNNFNKYYTHSGETAEEIFHKIIEDKTDNPEILEHLPKDIFKKNKYKILANMQEGYGRHSIIARKLDGNFVGSTVENANDKGYEIIFPQERSDYHNLVSQAINYNDPDSTGYSSFDNSISKAREVAKRIYGANYENRIKYLQQKAKDKPVSESDQVQFGRVN